jgi:hypothetical protein
MKEKERVYNPLNISLKYFSSIESNGTQGQLNITELKCKRVKSNVTSLFPFLRLLPKAALLPREPASPPCLKFPHGTVFHHQG